MASLADWGSKRENPKQHSLCLTEPVLRRDILRGPDLLGAFVVSPLLLSYCWKNPIPVSICPMSQISGSVGGSVMEACGQRLLWVAIRHRDRDLLSGFSSSVLGAAPCGSWAGSWGEAGFAADVVTFGSATIG